MKRFFYSFLTILVLASAIPANAATLSSTQESYLRAQIALLLQQIGVLEKMIALQAREQEPPEIYQTYYFKEDFEAVYTVTSQGLQRIDSNEPSDSTHLLLWNLFTNTVGEDNAYIYIDEFRIYDNDDNPIGAFVELKPHQVGEELEWLLAINASDFDFNDPTSAELYQDLLIHEYAHVLMYEIPDFVEAFTNEFWTSADRRHASRVEGYDLEDIKDTLESYYERHEDEFISDYATLNPAEDLAETFAYFVTEDLPRRADTKEEEKLRYLLRNDLLSDARDDIRNNLNLD